MSVYIKGIKMPICRTCPVCDEKLFGNYCRITEEIVSFGFEKGENCPLIPVRPHGRLIDADALMEGFSAAENTMYEHGREFTFSFLNEAQVVSTEWYYVQQMLEDAPTIIEAEEGES